MNQNWDDLRYFLAVCRTNSFAAAGARLHVTHSTVARRITALEESLETTLFLRTEKGCRLTPAGEALLPYAETMETSVMGLEESVSGKDSQLSGVIRIGAPDGLGNTFLAKHLVEFHLQHPHLEVELMAVPMYYSLSKREVDILITITKPTAGHVVARKIIDYRFGLFASMGYIENNDPITRQSDLVNHDLVDYIEDLLYDEKLKILKEFVPGKTSAFRSSTLLGQVNAIAAGAGIGMLPYFMTHHRPDLIPVLPEIYAERGFWLQVNPDSRQLARVRTMIDFIVSHIEANMSMFMELSSDK